MDGYQISFQFQVGLVRDRVTVDSASLNLKSIKSKACDFICEKFPQNGLTRLDERILLFKHDYKSTNILQMVNAVTDIQEDVIIEVVISAQQLSEEDVEIRPHQLKVHSYKTPTFCDYCGEMLFGMFKQGLKCEGCGMNFHKRCVFKIPNDCSGIKKKRRPSFSLNSSNASSTLSQSTSVPSSDGTFLVLPNRDGSVSPSTAKKERSTSMIAGKPHPNDRSQSSSNLTEDQKTMPKSLKKGVSFEEDKKAVLKGFRKGSKGLIIGKNCPLLILCTLLNLIVDEVIGDRRHFDVLNFGLRLIFEKGLFFIMFKKNTQNYSFQNSFLDTY